MPALSQKRLLATVLAIFALALIGYSISAIVQPHYFTVSEVWDRRDELNGQRITVAGVVPYFRFNRTLIGCMPRRCDCNQTWADSLFLADRVNINEKTHRLIDEDIVIEVKVLDCRGDECSMSCRPIDPGLGGEFAFNGELWLQDTIAAPYMVLRNVRVAASRHKAFGIWQPIPTGVFDIRHAQP